MAPLRELDPERACDPDWDRVAVCVAMELLDELGVWLGLGLCDSDELAVPVRVSVWLSVACRVGVVETVGVSLGVKEAVFDLVVLGVDDAEPVGD